MTGVGILDGGGGGHLERLHRVSPESTIFDVVSMVSRQDVTRLTVPNSLYAHIVYSWQASHGDWVLPKWSVTIGLIGEQLN